MPELWKHSEEVLLEGIPSPPFLSLEMPAFLYE